MPTPTPLPQPQVGGRRQRVDRGAQPVRVDLVIRVAHQDLAVAELAHMHPHSPPRGALSQPTAPRREILALDRAATHDHRPHVEYPVHQLRVGEGLSEVIDHPSTKPHTTPVGAGETLSPRQSPPIRKCANSQLHDIRFVRDDQIMTPLNTAVTTTIDVLDTRIEQYRYSLLPAIDVEVRAAGVARDDAHDVVHDLRARLERYERPNQHAGLTTDLETAIAVAKATDVAVADARQRRREMEDGFRALLTKRSDIADRLDDIGVLRGVGDTAIGQAEVMSQCARILDLSACGDQQVSAPLFSIEVRGAAQSGRGMRR